MFSCFSTDNSSDSEELTTELLTNLEDTIVEIEEEAENISVIVDKWENTSPTESFLLNEINACIKMIEKAKENIPSYIKFKKQHQLYTTAMYVAGTSTTLATGLGIAGLTGYIPYFVINPINNALNNIKKMQGAIVNNTYKSLAWKIYGPNETETKLKSLWNNWNGVKVNATTTIDCEIPGEIPFQKRYYLLKDWRPENTSNYIINRCEYSHRIEPSSCTDRVSQFSQTDYEQTRILPYYNEDGYSTGWKYYDALSNHENPCFLKQINFTHLNPVCNTPSGAACDTYQELLPYKLYNQNYLANAKRDFANYSIQTDYLERYLRENQSKVNNIYIPIFSTMIMAGVIIGCLSLIVFAQKRKAAYQAYQNDTNYSHKIYKCFTNIAELNRVINLCSRLDIAIKDHTIETLHDSLIEISNTLYAKRKCRLTFLNSEISNGLPKDIQTIILTMAKLAPNNPGPNIPERAPIRNNYSI